MTSIRAIPFPHRQSAHSESGVAAGLMGWNGLDLTEAMAFGIGGGLFFGYIPFIRLNGLPLVTYRAAAGHILRQVARIPGIALHERRFRNPDEAMTALDEALSAGTPVGLQTGVYWLPYFPRALRFHFNAHNLVVYGKEDNEYLISDPVFPAPVRCAAADLARARFAAGALAPRGRMYTLSGGGDGFAAADEIRRGISSVCRMMLGSPLPIIGVRGIRFLAGRMEKWPTRLGRERAHLHLGHVIRMQEEIGTGGAGFRYMYAAFLQEAEQVLADPILGERGAELTATGDLWRQFAAMAARICKERPREGDGYPALTQTLRQCAEHEEAVFRALLDWTRQRP
jgi:hypothetical protein